MSESNEELADFLRRTRAAIDPLSSRLPPDGRIRRVAGLRREEVATLAGVSTDYYTRLEQGRRITPSPRVLDAIANALQLDATGRSHLAHLVETSTSRERPPATRAQRVRPGLRQLLDALDTQPAMILGRRSDVLAVNLMGAALIHDFDQLRPQQRNYARWMFSSTAARELFIDWDEQARAVVENLRLDVGSNPGDPIAERLVRDLADESADFRRWWADHRVNQRTYGSKRLRHPIVGELSVDYETLSMSGDADQTMFVYSTPEGTASRQAMDLLVSWAMRSPSRAEPR